MDATKGPSCEGGLAYFDHPCLGRGVVSIEEGNWVGVPSGWVDHGEGVESCHIVDYERGVFEVVDGYKFAVFPILTIVQCVGLDIGGPFVIPPEFHVVAEAACCAEVAVTAADATWCSDDQVAEGSPHVNPWAGKGIMDDFELTVDGVVELEHQPGLVDQL